MKNKKLKMGLVAIAAVAGYCINGHAQSVDSLLDKLVDKGVLSVKEANDLREDSDKDFSKAYSAKSGMPDWATAIKFNGDFRGRFDGIYSENPAYVDRNRLRYRLRFGTTASLSDGLEVGLRLTSGEPSGAFGGDSISGNTSFTDNASKKFVYLDLAYAKWTPLRTKEWNGSVTFGKMENPFVFPSTMMFDKDYTPEGLAGQLVYTVNDQHAFKLIGGGFILDELSGNTTDPVMSAAQVRWDATWNKHVSTTVGVAGFAINNRQELVNGNVPNGNRGNTRNANLAPQYDFNPIYLDGGITYTLDEFPTYPGAFPITLNGDYVNNPAAPTDNHGYSVGLLFGKAGKKGTWEAAYRWEDLQADAWFEEFTESDFGAFYQAAPIGGAIGYGAGANVRGHNLKLSYSPYDCLTLSASCFYTDLINPSPAGSETKTTRVLVDAVLKF